MLVENPNGLDSSVHANLHSFSILVCEPPSSHRRGARIEQLNQWGEWEKRFNRSPICELRLGPTFGLFRFAVGDN